MRKRAYVYTAGGWLQVFGEVAVVGGKMRGLVLIVTSAALAAFSGCGNPSPPATKLPAWTAADVVGWVYSDESKEYRTSRYFDADGSCPHTSVAKNQVIRKPGAAPPAPVAPMFSWSIDPAGVLAISSSDRVEDTFQRWILKSLNATSATAMVNGQHKTFQRSRR